MKTFSRWHPQVKVGGKWAYVGDKSTISGIKEAPDEETALEQAIVAFRLIRSKGEVTV